MPPLLYDPPELTEDAARVETRPCPLARRHTDAAGCDGGVRRLLRLVPVWAPLRGVSPVLECVGGRARLARLPFIPGMVVVVVVVVAPLKPCILYKRKWEIDRQTIPL